MAWQAPSSVSSSPWYGPGSSPIISPSRWTQQVLNNLCVLALHNHSGSTGEGASTLSTALQSFTGQADVISPFFPSASTNWSLFTSTCWPGNGAISTSTNGASITYDVYWGPGTHNVDFFYGKGSSFGIITACVTGNSPVGTNGSIDGYRTGAELPAIGGCALTNSLATFSFRVFSQQEFTASGCAVTGSLVGSGRFQLKFAVSGSGASSTGYIARLGYMRIS